MRRRICYLLLLLLPVITYGPLVVAEFGTAEDLIHFGPADAMRVTPNIVSDALVGVTSHWISSVQTLSVLRGLSLGLLVLCAVALWQILERGGWGELQATALAVAMVLLPAAQVAVGWSTLWPNILAALLALAGFAAAESELETSGEQRLVGLIGGGLLYFAAAMCDFHAALIGLVPLAGLTITRSVKASVAFRRWYLTHTAVWASGLITAALLGRWMLHGAGLTNRTEIAMRLVDWGTLAFPSGMAGFAVSNAIGTRLLAACLGAALLGYLVWRDVRNAPERLTLWRHALAVFGIAFVATWLAPNWEGGYGPGWIYGSLLLVGIMGALGGAGAKLERSFDLPLAASAGIVVLGMALAYWQTREHFITPLSNEWEQMRTAVMKAKISGNTKVALQLPPPTVTSIRPGAGFSASVYSSPRASVQLFNAALNERFNDGLPKGTIVQASVAAPESGAVVIDLR